MTGRMLFEWPARYQVHLVLPLMLVVSVALHAVGILGFSISYPKTERRVADPASITMLLPDTPGAAALNAYTSGENPALFSPGNMTSIPLPDVRYTPGFDSNRLTLVPLDPPLVTPPAQRAFTPTTPADRTRKYAPPPPPRSLPTSIRTAGDLAKTTFTAPAPIAFSSFSPHPLPPTEFYVAITADGTPLHALAIQSSGNPTLDRDALRTILHGRFTNPAAAPLWGSVQVIWGSDVPTDPPKP